MIKNYSDFRAVVSGKCALYSQIPVEHLSEDGKKVYELYKALDFLISFAASASELLDLMNDDFAVEIAAIHASREHKTIRRCIERLAREENPTSGTKAAC